MWEVAGSQYFFIILGLNSTAMKVKKKIVTIIFASLPVFCIAQKFTTGTCVTRDGGQYEGQMVGSKPYGKGVCVYKNGDRYEGDYVQGERTGQGLFRYEYNRLCYI